MCDDHDNSQDPCQPASFEMTEGGSPDGTVRLALAGELDLASCGRLTARLGELAATGATVHLDISGVTFIDSTGLAVLVRNARDSRRDGWRFEIGRAGLHRQVRRVVELVGVDQILWPPQAPGVDPAHKR